METDIVTTNFNSTNPNDIVDDAEAIDSEDIDYLETVGYYRDDDEQEEEELAAATMGDDSQSSIDTTQFSQDLSLDTTQFSQELSQDDTTQNPHDTQDLTDHEGRSHARNVILENKPTISFMTDNAKDITKAIK